MGDVTESGERGAERWRPTRVGIRNIWEYDDQEFHFVDGRLILRGPNGSGKSNALALLVPFVFDAIDELGPNRPIRGRWSMKTLLLSEQKEEGQVPASGVTSGPGTSGWSCRGATGTSSSAAAPVPRCNGTPRPGSSLLTGGQERTSIWCRRALL